jgi:hypothetical protein
MDSSYSSQTYTPVSARAQEIRAAFITRTYMHLFGAILGFAAIEIFLFSSGLAEPIARTLLSGSCPEASGSALS